MDFFLTPNALAVPFVIAGNELGEYAIEGVLAAAFLILVAFAARRVEVSLGHVFLIGAVLVGIFGALHLYAREEQALPVSVAVLRDDLPAYRVITADDIEMAEKRRDDLPDAYLTEKDIVGRYGPEALSKGKPLTEDELGPVFAEGRLEGVVAYALTVPRNLFHFVYAGQLLSIAIVPQRGSPEVFEDVLVLGVFKDDEEESSDDEADPEPRDGRLVVIGLPAERVSEFAALEAAGTLRVLVPTNLN